MRTAFENEGDIRGTDLLAGLVALWREGASGSLQFSRSGATAGFEFVSGELTASSSSDPRFETASILVRAGKLEAATLERLAASEGADRALLALQAGILTRREWRWGEKIRAVEILSDLLTWIEGEYWFFRSAEREAAEARIPIPRLILELFLRSRDRSLVLHHLGGVDVPLARAESFDTEFATFGLTADAESVVRLIDGTSSAAEIASEAPAEAFAVEKLLAALVTLGLVHPAFAGSESEPAAVRAAAPARDAEEAEPSRDTAAPEDAPAPADEAEEADREEEVEQEVEVSGQAEAHETHELAADADFPAPGPPEEPEEYEPEDFRRSEASDEEAPMSDARFDGSPETESGEDELGAAGLAGEGPSGGLEGFEPSGSDADRFPDAPLDSSTGVGPIERPQQRSASPFLWVLAILVLGVAGLLWVRSRRPAGENPAAPLAVATPASEPTAPSAVATADLVPSPAPTETGVRPSTATAAPLSTRSAPTAAAPTPRPPAVKATPIPAPARVAAAEPATSTSRQHWLDRAARDRKKFVGSAKSRYAIQLELVCEIGSLVDAFQHDRPAGSMWVVKTAFEGKTCFRVLWGHYASVDAARRALPGAPAFFSTARNRPAVSAVR